MITSKPAINVRHTADLNQSWKIEPGSGKTVGIELNDTVKVNEDIRLTLATIQGKARIVSRAYDSTALSTYSPLVEKAQRNPALANAVTYFSEEVMMTARCMAYIKRSKSSLMPQAGRSSWRNSSTSPRST